MPRPSFDLDRRQRYVYIVLVPGRPVLDQNIIREKGKASAYACACKGQLYAIQYGKFQTAKRPLTAKLVRTIGQLCLDYSQPAN